MTDGQSVGHRRVRRSRTLTTSGAPRETFSTGPVGILTHPSVIGRWHAFWISGHKHALAVGCGWGNTRGRRESTAGSARRPRRRGSSAVSTLRRPSAQNGEATESTGQLCFAACGASTPIACPRCGEFLRMIATITDRGAIVPIPEHLEPADERTATPSRPRSDLGARRAVVNPRAGLEACAQQAGPTSAHRTSRSRGRPLDSLTELPAHGPSRA